MHDTDHIIIRSSSTFRSKFGITDWVKLYPEAKTIPL